MNTHIAISLDRRRSKKGGSFPIILRLTHESTHTTSLRTGFSVPDKYWDENKGKIRASYKGYYNVTRINNEIEKQRAKAIDTLTKLDERGELRLLTINQVKDKLTNPIKKGDTVFNFTQSLIDELREKKKIGNARSYDNVLREIKKFRKNKDFSFYELNYAWLLRFEKDYLSRGLSENGLAVYMRTIRAICNKAILAEIVEPEAYPFKNYTIKTKPTAKRAISMEAIQRIVVLDIPKESALFRTRNIFLMSFYMMGAPFVDLVFLKVRNIVDGRIQYQRQKTGRHYDIKITPQLKEILDFYVKGKDKNEFVLPLIKRETLEDQYRDLQSTQNRYNKQLKKIGEMAGIEEKLTSYVSRHSFATLADQMEIPITAISQMMGHGRISTTQIYLASLKSSVLDDYNEKILGN